ncbi:Alpha/Beta hydrolase protein [Hyaloraphidium curvatum]|nr:Alpha/Beta hydrolase protein [Hyaloraphidium curvatum]
MAPRLRLPAVVFLLFFLLPGTYHASGASVPLPADRDASQRVLPLPAGTRPGADSYRVTSLPGVPKDVLAQYTQHAGLVDVDAASRGSMFFWLVAGRGDRGTAAGRDKRPLILWLQGGPGCSGMTGLFLEHGPFRVVSAGEDGVEPEVRHNVPNWISAGADVLYVDQPVGTGFSTARSPQDWNRDELAVSANLVAVLEAWFRIFPAYRGSDFFVAGESYGGQYVPYLASAILKRNAAASGPRPINLKGIAIGNGKTDPMALYSSLIPIGDARGLFPPNTSFRDRALRHMAECAEEQNESLLILRESCEKVLQTVLLASRTSPRYAPCGANVYDLRIVDKSSDCSAEWPPGSNAFRAYVARSDVAKAVHADRSPPWAPCNADVGALLNNETVAPSSTLLPSIVRSGVRLLLYAGAEDMLCSPLSQAFAAGNLTWDGHRGFTNASAEEPFVLRGAERAGTAREEGRVALVTIDGASHLAPFDQPEAAAELIMRFAQGRRLASGRRRGKPRFVKQGRST